MALEGVVIRRATEADVPALHTLIEASVRGLQAGDYTPAEIEGALGHALGLDSQLVVDGTYFVAEVDGERVASGGWSYRATLFGGEGRGEDSGNFCASGVGAEGAGDIDVGTLRGAGAGGGIYAAGDGVDTDGGAALSTEGVR